MGAHWAADCARQWFNILGSIDYNYSFFRLGWRATPNPWNGIEIYIQSVDSRLKQETIGIVFNWDISTTLLPPKHDGISYSYSVDAHTDTWRETCNHVLKGKTFIKRFKLQDQVKKKVK